MTKAAAAIVQKRKLAGLANIRTLVNMKEYASRLAKNQAISGLSAGSDRFQKR
jgi:hypothetical protein